MANDAVVIRLKLENEQLARDLRKSETNVRKLETSVKKSATNMSSSLEKVGNSLQNTFSGGQIAQFASKFGPVGAAIAAVITAATALNVVLIDISKKFADMADQAQGLGIAVEEFQALRFAANQAGLDAEQLTKSLTKLGSLIGDIGAGENQKAVELLAKMGVNLENLMAASPDEQLKLLADGFATLNTQAEKAYAGSILFGKGYRQMIPLLDDGASGIQKNIDLAKELGLVIGTEDVEAMRKFDDSVELAKDSMSVFIANGAQPLVDYMNSSFARTMDDSKGYVEKVGDTFDDLISRISTFLGLQNKLREPPSITGAAKTKRADSEARVTEAAKAAYDADEKLFLDRQRKLTEYDKKLAESSVKAIEKSSVSASKSTAAAAALADKAKRDAEAYVESFKEYMSNLDSDTFSINAEIANFEGENLDQVRLAIQLAEDMAEAQAKFSGAELSAAEKSLQKRYELNSALIETGKISEANAIQAEKDAEKLADLADRNRQLTEGLASAFSNFAATMVSSSATAGEAMRALTAEVAKLIIQLLILEAFKSAFPGFTGAAGASAPQSGAPQINVFNYGAAPGGVQTRQNPNGQIDIIIGQMTSAINRGGNSFDRALRRTYGLGRVGS